ncbi:MAG TPA: hypothetical protein VIG99_27150, partial [Myxococcaceae bacterium]
LSSQISNPECTKGMCAHPHQDCGTEDHICRFDASLHATAGASVRVLGADFTLLESSFNSKVIEPSSHADIKFTVLGQQIVPPGGLDQGALAFDLAFPAENKALQSPGLSMTFMAGPIPIEVQAGASVSTGVDFQTEGSSDSDCGRKTAAPPAFRLSSGAHPYVRADAFAQGGVGIDLGIAEVSAGVRANLNLVNLSVPVNVTVGAGKSNDVISLEGTRGGAAIDGLSGDLSLYAEVDSFLWDDSWSVPLFAWSGFHQDIPFFSVPPQDLPVRDLSRAMFPAKATSFDVGQVPYPALSCQP